MDDRLRQALRLWTALVAGWAVLLAGVLPAPASVERSLGRPAAICAARDARAPAPAGGDHRHPGTLCCVLCGTAAAAALDAPSRGGVAPPRRPAVAADPSPETHGAPAPPAGAHPVNPRAPPVRV